MSVHLINGASMPIIGLGLAGKPSINKIKDEISKQKGLIASRMTGSGSSYFAIFEDRNATLLAEQQIKNYNSNWWTSIVSTI